MEAEYTITNFPVPPSVNKLYAHIPHNGGMRMIKTRDYRDYERLVYLWLTNNRDQVKGTRDLVRAIGEQVLHVDSTFHMGRGEIVCKNGKPKRNDTSNRLKALHDVLSSVIVGIDDCYFWSGSFSKVVIENEKEVGHVTITFKLRKI